MWFEKNPAAALGVEIQLDSDLGEVVLRDLAELTGGERVVQHIADDELAAVLLAELPVESPAQRVQFLLGLFGVKGDDGAVVLVALLPGDVDVVVQRDGIVREPALGDVGDRLAVDGLGDRQPQRLVGQDRSWCTVECEVIPTVSGRTPNRDPVGAPRDGQLVEGEQPGGVDGVVLQGGDSRGVVEHQIGDAVQQRQGFPTISGCGSARFAARCGRGWRR